MMKMLKRLTCLFFKHKWLVWNTNDRYKVCTRCMTWRHLEQHFIWVNSEPIEHKLFYASAHYSMPPDRFDSVPPTGLQKFGKRLELRKFGKRDQRLRAQMDSPRRKQEVR